MTPATVGALAVNAWSGELLVALRRYRVTGCAAWTFIYDDNGNLTSKSDGVDTWDYAWDEDNRLISVSLNSSPVVFTPL